MNLAIVALDLVRKISQGLADELQRLVTRINAWANVDHRPSGRHKFPWTKIPFDATKFTGNGTMTWTVVQTNMINWSYRTIDNVVSLVVSFGGTTTGGAANTDLNVQLPQAIAARVTAVGVVCRAQDTGASIGCYGTILAGASLLAIRRLDGANWGTPVTIRLWMDYEIAESAT